MTDLTEEVARAIFAKLNLQAMEHPLTDFDSEWANRRGDYMGIVTPSLVDQSIDVAQAAIAIVLERAAEVARDWGPELTGDPIKDHQPRGMDEACEGIANEIRALSQRSEAKP